MTVKFTLKGKEQAKPAIEANLLEEVARASATLGNLLAHKTQLGPETEAVITAALADVTRRLQKRELSVAVVGEKKAGKSTFLNALLGAEVLGTNARECTGTVTYITRSERPTYRAAFKGGTFSEFQNDQGGHRTEAENRIASLCSELEIDPVWTEQSVEETEIDLKLQQAKDMLVRATDSLEKTRKSRWQAIKDLAESKRSHESAVSALRTRSVTRDRLRQKIESIKIEVEKSSKTASDTRKAYQNYKAEHGVELELGDGSQMALAVVENASRAFAEISSRVPFLLRPGPWWAFWVSPMRWIFGRWYRDALDELGKAIGTVRSAKLGLTSAHAVEHLRMRQEELSAASKELAFLDAEIETLKSQVATTETTVRDVNEHLLKCESSLKAEFRTVGILTLEWEILSVKKLEIEELARFRSEVHILTDMEKMGSNVLELRIGFPAKHLPPGIVIIDTPGVNTDNAANRDLAWKAIRNEADGCILVTDLQQVLSNSTKDFLREVREIIPHILLVMTKVDKVIANAEGVGDLSPREQVEEARRIALKKFAKEMNRPVVEVFAVALAAKPALIGNTSLDGLGQHFPVEVEKLFNLLDAERAIVLGARAASAIRACVQRINDAQQAAEAGYNKRINELEAQKLPNPHDFQKRQIEKIEPELRAQAKAIAQGALNEMHKGVHALRDEWCVAISRCESKDEVKSKVARLGGQAPKAIGEVMKSIEKSISLRSEGAIATLEQPLLAELRERYRIVQRITNSGHSVKLEAIDRQASVHHASNVTSGVSNAIANFENEQFAVGAGGAMAGAAIGTFMFPGIGTVVGAAIGAMAGFFVTLDTLKNDCYEAINNNMEQAKQNLAGQLSTVGPDIQRRMRDALAGGLSNAVAAYQSWIDEIMAAELAQINTEREKLSHLIATRQTLIGHDERLVTLRAKASELSRGLCK